MAQSVKHLTPDFGSGHDPRVVGLSHMLTSALGMETAWDSLSSSLSASPPLILHSLSVSVSLSLSKTKTKIVLI